MSRIWSASDSQVVHKKADGGLASAVTEFFWGPGSWQRVQHSVAGGSLGRGQTPQKDNLYGKVRNDKLA
jgi:hypothetical protein